MKIEQLIDKIKTDPQLIEFEEVMQVIAEHYHYTPTRFSNGLGVKSVINEAGTNEGSCKIFSFAKINQLNKEQTLACFGKYYRQDVLQHPEASDHANIRTFMVSGWEGVQFDSNALSIKQ